MNDKATDEDSGVLEKLREIWRNELKFFSNDGKKEREVWVVSEFLRVFGVQYQESELISFEQNSDVDIGFREARFQVKELSDPNLRRYKDIKETFRSIQTANRLDEISWAGTAQDCPAPTRMYELICEQAKELSAKYSSRERIDLLFYVTRTFASIVQKDEIDSNDLKSLGWRSVSCVNARQAIVLFVSRDCPKFLHAPFLK